MDVQQAARAEVVQISATFAKLLSHSISWEASFLLFPTLKSTCIYFKRDYTSKENCWNDIIQQFLRYPAVAFFTSVTQQ